MDMKYLEKEGKGTKKLIARTPWSLLEDECVWAFRKNWCESTEQGE